jgi:phosphatidylserine/phosphatidylglycerophosphate/cardiolipin synthase-like enzyme
VSVFDRARWHNVFAGPPTTTGNTFTLLAGGPAIYAALARSIRAARHEILLETYIWNKDATGRAFLAAVAAAARRGVKVRILVDGVGSFGLVPESQQPLLQSGAQFRVFNRVRLLHGWSRLFMRDHRKVAIIDGRMAFTGGFGYGDQWAGLPPSGWWDVGVRVAGPVVGQFRRAFAAVWRRSGPTAIAPTVEHGPPHPGTERLRFVPSRIGRHELFKRLRRAAHPARQRVYICTTYFIPSLWVRHALRRAARRGVDVRLLLPGPEVDHVAFRFAGRRHYGSLLAAGVRIFEYQPSFLHAKYALVDSDWGLLGSSNLDSWSSRFNLEADLEIHSRRAVGALADRFMRDLRLTREITSALWTSRSMWVRFAERFFGGFDPWL